MSEQVKKLQNSIQRFKANLDFAVRNNSQQRKTKYQNHQKNGYY